MSECMEYPLELEKKVIGEEVNISKALSIVINTKLKRKYSKMSYYAVEPLFRGHLHDQGKCNNNN